jgi:hypothetical protein
MVQNILQDEAGQANKKAWSSTFNLGPGELEL